MNLVSPRTSPDLQSTCVILLYSVEIRKLNTKIHSINHQQLPKGMQFLSQYEALSLQTL